MDGIFSPPLNCTTNGRSIRWWFNDTTFGKPSDWYLFGPLNNRFHKNEGVETAIHEWLQMQDAGLHLDGILKAVQVWNKCISVLRNSAGKQWYFFAGNELYLMLWCLLVYFFCCCLRDLPSYWAQFVLNSVEHILLQMVTVAQLIRFYETLRFIIMSLYFLAVRSILILSSRVRADLPRCFLLPV